MLHNLTQCRGEGEGLGWHGLGVGATGEGGDKANTECIFQHDLSPRGGSSC